MLKILLVTPEKNRLSEMATVLETHDDVRFSWVESGTRALKQVAEAPVNLVVSDGNTGDMTGLELASKMLTINPMINCAVISTLSPDDFHEASEGLGLLAQLPPQPGKEETERLLGRLKEVMGLLNSDR